MQSEHDERHKRRIEAMEKQYECEGCKTCDKQIAELREEIKDKDHHYRLFASEMRDRYEELERQNKLMREVLEYIANDYEDDDSTHEDMIAKVRDTLAKLGDTHE